MEKGHIKILENFRSQGIEEIKVPIVDNMTLADYLVESKPTANMTYQDILIIAMKKEEKANLFYTRLANESTESENKKIFQSLAAEEAKHKFQFETIYDEEILKEN